ncbi:ATP-binding cassette domain-containing protein [Xenorhabdus siamensis]|uniref:ATP-binding cassette domain-containing protein n=1 Tax=Xenorhabdus siamensis TaxID=3136254 RepID=UPI0030F41A2B
MDHINTTQSTAPILLVINMQGLTRTYQQGEKGEAPVLNNITTQIFSGQSCAIVGTSDSGKSTLLNILGLLDKPTAGKYFLCGIDMSTADEILSLLSSIHTNNAMTLVLIIYDSMVANHMQREFRILYGQLYEIRGMTIHA